LIFGAFFTITFSDGFFTSGFGDVGGAFSPDIHFGDIPFAHFLISSADFSRNFTNQFVVRQVLSVAFIFTNQ